MKREIDVRGNKLLVLYRIIVVIMLLLVVLLIAGSLYALLRSKDSGPLFRIGASREGNAVSDGGTGRGGEGGGIIRVGTMRIQNSGKQAVPSGTALPSGKAGQDPAVIIISISFPYKADDRPFSEELASNLGKFRSITANYFANLPRDSLSRLDEEQAKAEILRQYNAQLRLGRIETLYFGDLLVLGGE